MKKYPSRIQEDLREKHTKSSAYDVARTGVMAVLQHTPIWVKRERERRIGYMQQIPIIIF